MSSLTECNYTGGELGVTDDMKRGFNDDGYILVRNLFNAKEMENLRRTFSDDVIKDHFFGVGEKDGNTVKMLLWNQPGNDVSGIMARCHKVVDTCEQLLGEEVYHYHGKLVYKNPFSGGKFVWHQDYGYWYGNGCLKPTMMTVFVAIDKCTISNGCLKIIPKSNKCGRINHEPFEGQQRADPERVAEIENKLPSIFVELEAGDALFFHSNVLHTSTGNDSPDRRWAYLMAYNTKSNNPVYVHHHPYYSAIKKVANSSIEECKIYSDVAGKEYMVNADMTEEDLQKTLKKGTKMYIIRDKP